MFHKMYVLTGYTVPLRCPILPPPSSALDNSRRVTSGGTKPQVHLEFCQYGGHMSSYVDYRLCPVVASPEGQADICQRFSVSCNHFFLFFFTQRNVLVVVQFSSNES